MIDLLQTNVVTVPTPIDTYWRPDLSPLLKASESIDKVIRAGDVVIYKSTVIPALPRKTAFLGYDPELILAGRRINDGMGSYVVSQLIKAMIKKRIQVEGMRFTPTAIPEVVLIEPKVFEDGRGFFMETWRRRTGR